MQWLYGHEFDIVKTDRNLEMVAELKERFDSDGRPSLYSSLPLDTPMSLFVEPTNLCNFRCTFCPTGEPSLLRKTKLRQHIPVSIYESAIQGAGKFSGRIKKLHLNKDGEPFLNPGIIDLIRIAHRSRNFDSIETISNGSLLSDYKVDEIVSSGLNVLKISIYGTTSQEYAANVRRNVDIDRIIKSIRSLYLASRGSALKIYVKMMRSENERSNERFINCFQEISDRVFIEEKVEQWPSFSSLVVKPLVNVYRRPLGAAKSVCTLPFYSMVVNATGTVSACCVDWKNELILGDLSRQTLDEIWDSEGFNSFRVQMLQGRRRISACATCDHPDTAQPDSLDGHVHKLLHFYQKY